jgi:oxygen-dependent protoporphyrinogen oxidase
VSPNDHVPLDELADQAGRVRVAVIGGGIAGLVAALECTKVGLQVTVFETSERLGGTVSTVELDGIRVDTGADCFASRGRLARLVDELGLAGALIAPATETRWVVGTGGGDDAAPLPEDTLLGIPENMFGHEAQAILGTGGTWRAYLDRLRPPLTIGHERRLSVLVRTRMGQKVLDRLVAPLAVGVYGAVPDDIDVDAAAPGLNAALTRTGSLSGAVATLRAQRGGSAIRSVEGGMSRLVDALGAQLRAAGAEIRVATSVSALEPPGDRWTVRAVDEDLEVDAVIVATPEASARALLNPVVPTLDTAPSGGIPIETVTLVVDAPGLDAHPRGAEALALPGSRAAAAALHLTAKWGIGDGRHVVRIAFGGPDTAPATAGLDDAAATEMAATEAAALFDVAIERVRAAHRARFTLAPSHAVTGRRRLATQARNAIEAVPRLAATGAWLSGSGLAQVADDAAATADRLRRRALFSD